MSAIIWFKLLRPTPYYGTPFNQQERKHGETYAKTRKILPKIY